MEVCGNWLISTSASPLLPLSVFRLKRWREGDDAGKRIH
jgi:hypothetical protein